VVNLGILRLNKGVGIMSVVGSYCPNNNFQKHPPVTEGVPVGNLKKAGPKTVNSLPSNNTQLEKPKTGRGKFFPALFTRPVEGQSFATVRKLEGVIEKKEVEQKVGCKDMAPKEVLLYIECYKNDSLERLRKHLPNLGTDEKPELWIKREDVQEIMDAQDIMGWERKEEQDPGYFNVFGETEQAKSFRSEENIQTLFDKITEGKLKNQEWSVLMSNSIPDGKTPLDVKIGDFISTTADMEGSKRDDMLGSIKRFFHIGKQNLRNEVVGSHLAMHNHEGPLGRAWDELQGGRHFLTRLEEALESKDLDPESKIFLFKQILEKLCILKDDIYHADIGLVGSSILFSWDVVNEGPSVDLIDIENSVCILEGQDQADKYKTSMNTHRDHCVDGIREMEKILSEEIRRLADIPSSG